MLTDPTRTRRSIGFQTAVFVVLTCVMMLSAEIWHEVLAYQARLKDAETHLANLASALAQNAGDTVKIADSMLDRIVRQIEADGTSPSKIVSMGPMLSESIMRQPRLYGLVIFDKNGDWIATSLPVKGRNVSDRAHFSRHRQNADLQAFIGPPYQNSVNGRWLIPVTRRINTPQGDFAGVALASIDMSYFVDRYAGFDLEPGGAITLGDDKGTILARFPWSEAVFAQPYSNANVLKQPGRAGVSETVDVITQQRRISAFHRNDGYPLILVVSIPKDEVLAAWRQDAILHLTITVGLVIVVALLGIVLARHATIAGQTLERLRENEALLRRIETVAGVGGWELDLRTEELLWTDETRRIHGVPPGYRPSLRSAIAFYEPEMQPLISEAVQNGAQTGKPWDIELSLTRADGKRIWVRAVGEAAMENGKPVRLTGAVQDVTERVLALQALEDANERVRLATAAGGIGIWDRDLVNDTSQWDECTYRIFGAADSDRHLSVRELFRRSVHPADLPIVEVAISDAIDGIRPFDTEFRVIHCDGSVRHIRGMAQIQKDRAGRPTHMIGVNWDVTEHRRLTAALIERSRAADQANEAKSDFLATISHEIRSPISSLIGVIEFLSGTGLSAEQAQMVQMAHASATDLLAVLNDVLDFSKIDAGALVISRHPTALRVVIDDVVRPRVIEADRKGLRLTTSVALDVPAFISMDALRLKQILGNLLSNAIKFTKRGEIGLHVDVVERDMTGHLRFAVSDTGIGMSGTVIAELFQPFMQGDSATTRRFGGTGLGLCISQKLAGLLGGEISVQSRLGEGSVFTLMLPLLVSPIHVAETTPGDLDVAVPSPRFDGSRALVVDDDPAIQWLSQQRLAQLGITADVATDGAEAMRLLHSAHYDVLLTDCHMPDMDGVTLARSVRTDADAALRDLPIIGLTADATELQRNRCEQAGMSAIAIKPISDAQLVALLSVHLRSDVSPVA